MQVYQSVFFILLHISATQEKKGFYSCELERTEKTCHLYYRGIELAFFFLEKWFYPLFE